MPSCPWSSLLMDNKNITSWGAESHFQKRRAMVLNRITCVHQDGGRQYLQKATAKIVFEDVYEFCLIRILKVKRNFELLTWITFSGTLIHFELLKSHILKENSYQCSAHCIFRNWTYTRQLVSWCNGLMVGDVVPWKSTYLALCEALSLRASTARKQNKPNSCVYF